MRSLLKLSLSLPFIWGLAFANIPNIEDQTSALNTIASNTAVSNPPTAAPLTEEQTKIAAIIQPWMKQAGIPGVVVETYANGTPNAYYFGYTGRDKTTLVNENTLFEVGSITKVFTSLLLAQEVLKRNMNLNDPSGEYIPELEQNKQTPFDRITLRHLATHTGSLPYDEPSTIKTPSQALRYYSQWHSPFRAGQNWAYSNVGMGLLGYALENETHQPLDQLYRQNILLPLGMAPIGTQVPAEYQTYRAKGYNRNGDFMPPREQWVFPAAGALKASGKDMQKFLSACLCVPGTPRFIEDAMRLTQTPFASTGDTQQGLAWVVIPLERSGDTWILPKSKSSIGPTPAVQLNSLSTRFNPRAVIEKTGTIDGFRSYIGIIPIDQSGVVLLANRYPPRGDITRIGHKLLLAVN